jgi:hypothetical protein
MQNQAGILGFGRVIFSTRKTVMPTTSASAAAQVAWQLCSNCDISQDQHERWFVLWGAGGLICGIEPAAALLSNSSTSDNCVQHLYQVGTKRSVYHMWDDLTCKWHPVPA